MSEESTTNPPLTSEQAEDEDPSIINPDDDFVFFLAVHAGAGYHSEDNSSLYRKSMKEALNAAYTHIQSNPSFSAVDAVEKAIFDEEKETLELDPMTNAGIGSNLTIEGQVECDASIMEGKNSAWFGAVGAVACAKNPIKIARKILDQRKRGLLSLGRIPPMLLVGEGARKFGDVTGEPTVESTDMVTEKSKQAWQKYTVMVQTHNGKEVEETNSTTTEDELLKQTKVDPDVLSSTTPLESQDVPRRSDFPTQGEREAKRMRVEEQQEAKSDLLQDTVGAVCILWRKCDKCKLGKSEISFCVHILVIYSLTSHWCDCGHTTAAGVSSGGILMKFPGRVGEAAMYGSGCWAQQYSPPPPKISTILEPLDPSAPKLVGKSVACSTSGTGEQIMQGLLAMNCAHSLNDPSLYADEALKAAFDQFLRQPDIQLEKYGGVLGCQAHTEEGVLNVEGIWGHTTESMAIGYLATGLKAPKTFISRLPTAQSSPVQAGFVVTISSTHFRYSKPS